ncbi:MAG: cytochrome oxidase subunit III [Ignavibacteria bacterium CG_4_9_14_3_um_filter_36_18]|nr:c-type cytochrome [Ignavibacteria bacterium]PJB00882.1 MAG: cytochrome oxidase subunit III [Ignavibacteria bacterium CG_4_9_14_3_um_filter_36_18]
MVNWKKIVFNAPIAVVCFLLSAVNLFAQASATAQGQTETEIFNETYYDTVAILILGVVVLIVVGFLYFGQGAGEETPEKATASVWGKIKYFLTRSTPIEKEKDIMLDHDYDGIKELDNRIPPWWTYLFYGSIIFTIYYLLNYHVFNSGLLQAEEYNQEMQVALMQRAELEKSGVLVNEETVTLLTDAGILNEGKDIYTANCVACHGPLGGGLVGPNLTDNYWINGGGIKNIFKTIKFGVPAKGMISWETQLNSKQIQAVASYVVSLNGTNPPAAKQPEGNFYSASDSLKGVN